MLADTYDVAALEKSNPGVSMAFNDQKMIRDYAQTFNGIQYNAIYSERYVILNTDDPAASSITFETYKGDNINSEYVVVKSPKGKITRYGLSDFTVKETEHGWRTYTLNIPATEKGTLVASGLDYSYTRYYFPHDFDFNILHSYPIKNSEIKFIIPKSWIAGIKKTSPGGKSYLKESSLQDKGKLIYSYNAKNLPAYKKEIFSPYYRSTQPYIQMLLYIDGYNYYPSADLRWRVFCRDFQQYVMDKDEFFSTSVGSKARELAANTDDPYVKMKNIFTFIQNNIKISHDYVSRDFPEILEAKQGSMYEICGLMYYMLKKGGINSDYLLIHSSSDGYFDTNYTSIQQFDMPAVRATIGNKAYVLLPFMKYLPMTEVPQYILNETAMIISPKPDVCGTLWKIPGDTYIRDSINTDISMQIEPDGKISVSELHKYYGYSAYDNRTDYCDLTDAELEKTLRHDYLVPDAKVSNFSYQLTNLKNIEDVFTIKLNYTIDNLVTITPEEVLFQTGGFLSPTTLYSQKIDTTDRMNPIEILYKHIINKNIKISYPNTWTLQSNLQDTTVDNKFGTSTLSTKTAAGLLEVDRVTVLKKSTGEKKETPLLYDVLFGNQKRNFPVIVFNTGK
jgi:hypothetical protein